MSDEAFRRLTTEASSYHQQQLCEVAELKANPPSGKQPFNRPAFEQEMLAVHLDDSERSESEYEEIEISYLRHREMRPLKELAKSRYNLWYL